jgi:uncharacterized protein DUF2846
MKAALAVIFLCASVLAQQKPATPSPQASCGPQGVRFDAHVGEGQLPTHTDPGKALVVVAEDFRPVPGRVGSPTIKVGVDGSWMGATHGSSYLYFAIDPGEHHVCVELQTHLKRYSDRAFAHVTAEVGKTYYFRARELDLQAEQYLDLDAVDADEAQYLVASSQLSQSRPK